MYRDSFNRHVLREYTSAGQARIHHGHVYHGVAHRVVLGHQRSMLGTTLGAVATGSLCAMRCAPFPPCH
jgi:hypothetical protein